MKDMIDSLGKAPITPNEFRDSLGYDPLTLDGMDTVYIPSSVVPVDLGIVAPDPNNPNNANDPNNPQP